MKVINFAKQNTVINQYVAELRDVNIQKDHARFRFNLERIGQMMAYEISKTLIIADPELNEHCYIVPGLGDAGDLAYGEKI